MIVAKRIKVISKDDSQLEYGHVTQLYTMGNHVVIVYEDGRGSYNTAKFPVVTLSKMEVKFND